MKESGTLYVIGTPIGNLKDITFRALEVLGEVDVLLAEDTRVAKKLLTHFDIQAEVWRCDSYKEKGLIEKVVKEMKGGRSFALVSDSGTPAVSDPGASIVCGVQGAGLCVSPVPGASSVTAFLSVLGIESPGFTFVGYPPHKKGRKKFFSSLKDVPVRPVVLFESPHRIQKTFADLSEAFGLKERVVVGRELTKIHEEIFSGSLEEAQKYFVGEKERGEFVLGIE